MGVQWNKLSGMITQRRNVATADGALEVLPQDAQGNPIHCRRVGILNPNTAVAFLICDNRTYENAGNAVISGADTGAASAAVYLAGSGSGALWIQSAAMASQGGSKMHWFHYDPSIGGKLWIVGRESATGVVYVTIEGATGG